MYGKVYHAPVVGWSGVFRAIADHSYRPIKGVKPSSIHGVVSLWPRRKDRWIETRSIGAVCLDLYFTEYNSDLIGHILRLRLGTPIYFWGKIRDRYSYLDDEFNEYPNVLDIDGFDIDSSNGRNSYLKATLKTSSLEEFLGR